MTLSKILPREIRIALYGVVLDTDTKKLKERVREMRQMRQRRKAVLSLCSQCWFKEYCLIRNGLDEKRTAVKKAA